MRRVNVRLLGLGSRVRIHRALTCAPNDVGEDRRTYCGKGAIAAEDTTDPVTCSSCLQAMPRLEGWPLNHRDQASAGLGISATGIVTGNFVV